MRRIRYVCSSLEVKEQDRIVPGDPENMLCVSGVGFFLTIFFENQKALDLFKAGVDSVRMREEVGGEYES